MPSPCEEDLVVEEPKYSHRDSRLTIYKRKEINK